MDTNSIQPNSAAFLVSYAREVQMIDRFSPRLDLSTRISTMFSRIKKRQASAARYVVARRRTA